MSWFWPFPPKPVVGSPLMIYDLLRKSTGQQYEYIEHTFGVREHLRTISVTNGTDICTIRVYLRDASVGGPVVSGSGSGAHLTLQTLMDVRMNHANERHMWQAGHELTVASPLSLLTSFWNTDAGDDLRVSIVTEKI